MKKFLPFSKRQPSLDRFSINRNGWSGADRLNGKSFRKISATSLNSRSIQVVRGAYNIDLNKVDSSFSKLHRACLLNDDALVRKQIHKVDNNSHDSSHRYPLHLAAVNGNYAIVKLLIENKADPNVQDNEKNTPLVKTIECGHEHLVQYLLSNGADPNISDSEGNNALHWAIITDSTIAIEALLGSERCDLSQRNNKGETCLHLAVRSQFPNSQILEAMISSGCDLDAKDQLGLTAYDIAQACNNKAAIASLERVRDLKLPQDSTNNVSTATFEDAQTNMRRLCEDYRAKYLIKNRENLEYEKRFIQLNAIIERLKVDLNFMNEQNSKLDADFKNAMNENSAMKKEISDLLDQIKCLNKKNNSNQSAHEPNRVSSTTEACASKNIDLDDLNLSSYRSHEEFLTAKKLAHERINKLKYGLSTPLTPSD